MPRTYSARAHGRHQLTIVDDDRVGRGSRSYEDDSRTDGKNNEATGAECHPHATDSIPTTRNATTIHHTPGTTRFPGLRHAVIFPALSGRAVQSRAMTGVLASTAPAGG